MHKKQTAWHEASKTTASAATNRVEDHEALQSCATVGTLADTVEHQVNNLLTHGVVAVCKVVGGILLPSNQLLRVEQLAVSASANSVVTYS